jgi:hypothetical protein
MTAPEAGEMLTSPDPILAISITVPTGNACVEFEGTLITMSDEEDAVIVLPESKVCRE